MAALGSMEENVFLDKKKEIFVLGSCCPSNLLLGVTYVK